MKKPKDPSGRQEILEILRRKEVPFTFTAGWMQKQLPHRTGGNVSGHLHHLVHSEGVLDVLKDKALVPYTSRSGNTCYRYVLQFRSTQRIHSDVPVKSGYVASEGIKRKHHHNDSTDSAERLPSGAHTVESFVATAPTDGEDRATKLRVLGHELLTVHEAARDSVLQALDRMLALASKVEEVATSPGYLKFVPTQKLKDELKRRKDAGDPLLQNDNTGRALSAAERLALERRRMRELP